MPEICSHRTVEDWMCSLLGHPASDSAMDLRRYAAVVTKYVNIERLLEKKPGNQLGG